MPKAYRAGMLHEFLISNRLEIIRRCHEKAAKRHPSSRIPDLVDHGVPLFLAQLVETLRAEQLTPLRRESEPEPTPAASDIGRAAAMHGTEMLRRGYSIDQVVHDYGDICQAVTELACEDGSLFSADEYRTLNRCLDSAIADAVTAYGQGGKDAVKHVTAQQERCDQRVREYQRLLDMAIKAYSAIKTGDIGVNGATGSVLGNILYELRDFVHRPAPGVPSEHRE